ncbi:hypothetical protein ACIXTH_12260, partial [Bacteroides fragilis]
NIKTCKRPKYTLIYQQTNELRGVEKKSGESFSTFSASVPRPGTKHRNHRQTRESNHLIIK